ncbi:39S ribosomal protein L21, mitochondrial [Orussus abietinus]|uniref:39S ribosomal protein L21, mitochondrial n=1 Tax=Orussus abietinus TaxID=222816 RepID=UPI000626EB66|nr:39S ribosomal protein L21, mitochondrial [Orussus abietinus]
MVSLSMFSRGCYAIANSCLKSVGTNLFSRHSFIAQKLQEPIASGLRSHLPWMPKIPEHQTEVIETTKYDEKLTNDVIQEVNREISEGIVGRLFAVIHICGKQFKVTENDIIIVEGYWPPNPGDKLTLEKVMLVGSSNFTLIGRPILNRSLATVDVTVIEKTMSHTKTRFRMLQRKQFKRINFLRVQHTMVRINSINLNRGINEKREVDGLDRIF